MFKKFILHFCTAFFLLLIATSNAYCNFDVTWGNSDDNGLKGYQQLGQWLVDNNYYEDLGIAKNFARTGYFGYNDNQDPFYWSLDLPITSEIVQETAGFSDQNTFGFYTGGGYFKNRTQIFSGIENGLKTLTINEPFGFYLGTPENNFWYTDRHENDMQAGSLRLPGGSSQALIYELAPESEWLIAWEDLDATSLISDRDFNDMYVKVTVVPEPVSSTLFLLGSIAFGARIRKKGKIN